MGLGGWLRVFSASSCVCVLGLVIVHFLCTFPESCLFFSSLLASIYPFYPSSSVGQGPAGLVILFYFSGFSVRVMCFALSFFSLAAG